MLRILLIDDDATKVAKYKELLGTINEINPRFVDVATCIEQAEEFVSKNQYDLAVLDLYIPIRFGEEPSPDNAVSFLRDLSSDDDLLMPYNIVGITRWLDADPKYRAFFDSYLLAYILYEEGQDDWKTKLSNKISFLLKAQKSVRNQEVYDFDVAIINALLSENEKVRASFGAQEWQVVEFPSDHSTTFYTKTVVNDRGEHIRIVTCYALQMASTASSALTSKLLYYFRPRYLFMTGIAAAVDREEANLGDILVAKKVWDGASGKIKTDEEGNAIFYPDYHELPLDTDVQAIVTRLKSDRPLLNNIEEGYAYTAGKPQTRLQLHLGPIASVPAVLSRKEEVDKIQVHCRKLLGIEMEGFGVFYAASNSAHPRPQYTVLVKSVSDYADTEKSDDFQDYAMYTSAEFAKHVIMHELKYD
ncbi:Nucleoside phosphorylase [Xylanibacter ruminicola]|uniref:Nucleoside phosphorylase n=1 Tax=Xylanibacter ruminicola TaxID=839 RepID=A0A1H4C445_XYLRU|nr:hypothetical protein [Xylanibacter ruminicola]SEA55063.1 Nucleoside phosphorylase [Xylanibacter ruminicola]